jgi:hypothetical protein
LCQLKKEYQSAFKSPYAQQIEHHNPTSDRSRAGIHATI